MNSYTEMTDDQLESERLALIGELDRRRALERVPADLLELARQYQEAGGDPASLKEVLDGSLLSPQ